MSDWIDGLSPTERSQWDEFVEHFRREAVRKIAGSDAFIGLCPDGTGDVKFWSELGCGIMLDKPLVIVALDGRAVPDKLRRLADVVVEGDIDTDEGAQRVHDALSRVIGTTT